MNNPIFKILALMVFLFVFQIGRAQCNNSYSVDCLGLHCYVTVDINNDPVTSDGYLKYTISKPQESIKSIQGPTAAYLSNDLGGTIDIYINKMQLLPLTRSITSEIPYELLVNKWVDKWGATTTMETPEAIQCHYHVVLLITQ